MKKPLPPPAKETKKKMFHYFGRILPTGTDISKNPVNYHHNEYSDIHTEKMVRDQILENLPVFWNHETQIGKIKKSFLSPHDKSVFVIADIDLSTKKGKDAANEIEEGKRNGLSLTNYYEAHLEPGKVLEERKPVELSNVYDPRKKGCNIWYHWRDKEFAGEEESKKQPEHIKEIVENSSLIQGKKMNPETSVSPPSSSSPSQEIPKSGKTPEEIKRDFDEQAAHMTKFMADFDKQKSENEKILHEKEQEISKLKEQLTKDEKLKKQIDEEKKKEYEKNSKLLLEMADPDDSETAEQLRSALEEAGKRVGIEYDDTVPRLLNALTVNFAKNQKNIDAIERENRKRKWQTLSSSSSSLPTQEGGETKNPMDKIAKKTQEFSEFLKMNQGQKKPKMQPVSSSSPQISSSSPANSDPRAFARSLFGKK